MSRAKAVIVSAIALLLIYGQVVEVLTEAAPNRGISIDNDDEAPLMDTDAFAQELRDARNVDDVLAALESQRGALNLDLFRRVVVSRTAWLSWFERALDMLALGILVLLFIRFRTYRERSPWQTVPLFLMTAAAVLVLLSTLIGFVVSVQTIQVGLAAFGAPNLVVTDAFIHYVLFIGDPDIAELIAALQEGLALAPLDPMAALGVVKHLFDGVLAAQQSAVLDSAIHVISNLTWVIDLYAPAVAGATALVAYTVLRPIVIEQLRYPSQVLDGELESGVWRYIRSQLGVWWREFRAVLWMMLFIILLTVLAVLTVRLLAFPMVIGVIKTLLATEAHLRAGGAMPDIGLVASLCCLVLYLVVCSVLCIAPLGIILGKAYSVVRDRLLHKRRFRDYGLFWRAFRLAGSGIAGRTALTAVVIGASYYWLAITIASPVVRVWLPVPLYGLAFWMLIARGKPIARLLEVYRTDQLGINPSDPH